MTMSDLQSLFILSWVLLCVGLVLVMQAGFTCLETGLARTKTSINVSIKNVVDCCVAAVIYWWRGFACMFGAGTSVIDLADEMDAQPSRVDVSCVVSVEAHTEDGQIAVEYNRVLIRSTPSRTCEKVRSWRCVKAGKARA